jgi:hypothetical protein
MNSPQPSPTAELQQLLQAEFHWSTDSKFTLGELQTILSAGRDIRSFVEGILPGLGNKPGQGAAWMNRWLAGIRFHSGGLPQRVVTYFNKTPTSLVFPFRDIWFVKDLDKYANPRQHVTHEIGHVLDNRSGPAWLPSIWFGKGQGDGLVRFSGGQPKGLRWNNGVSGIPAACRWTPPGAPTECGDLSTADYFAEAFTWAIYDPTRCPHPGMVEWLKEKIRGM